MPSAHDSVHLHANQEIGQFRPQLQTKRNTLDKNEKNKNNTKLSLEA